MSINRCSLQSACHTTQAKLRNNSVIRTFDAFGFPGKAQLFWLPHNTSIINSPKFDATAAAFFIEPRHPFFDKRLVEFCLALPSRQKVRQGWDRIVLRRAMANILPVEVQWRFDKADFRPLFRRGLLTFDRTLTDDVILRNPEVIEEYVDIKALRDIYFRCVFQGQGASGVDARAVWKAVVLALWLRQAFSLSTS